jgi:sortase A
VDDPRSRRAQQPVGDGGTATARKPGRMRVSRRAVGTALLLLSVGMVVAAVWLGAYPFYTNVRAEKKQTTLVKQFEQIAQTTTKEEYQAGKVPEGSALTQIEIPKLGVKTVVVEGTNATALAAGAGHYRDTALPGEPGNVSIAGHRTMNGRPFARMDELKPGDKVILVTPFARHTYELIGAFQGHANPWVTTPNDWGVVAATKEPMLTLTTCHPKGSARERLVARAKLVGSSAA